MADLMRVGKRILNLDNVTEIVDVDSDTVRVVFNVAVDISSTADYSNMQLDSTDFSGKEAEALRWYLSSWQGRYIQDVVTAKHDAETCSMEGCESLKAPKSDWCQKHAEDLRDEETVMDIPF